MKKIFPLLWISHRGSDLLESWNFFGLGDAALLTEWALNFPESKRIPKVELILGKKFPTGKTGAGYRFGLF